MNNDDSEARGGQSQPASNKDRAASHVVRILTECEGCGRRWMVIWAGTPESVLIEALNGDERYEVNAAVCPACEQRLAEGHMAAITAAGDVVRVRDYCFDLVLNTVAVN